MKTYRIYFFGDRVINGRHDNDTSGLQIAHALFDACSDNCQSFELWQGARMVYVPRTYRQMSFTEMSAAHQQAVIETEETLAQSRWNVAKSRRLLERLKDSSPERWLSARN